MLHDYFSFGSQDQQVEIANLNRFVTYTPKFGGAAMLARFPRIRSLMPAYVNSIAPTANYDLPSTDNAPWFEVGIPESEGFGGWAITGVRSGGGAPFTRQVFPGASGGGSFGPGRLGERSLVLDLIGSGAGELNLDYGFEWITQLMMGKGIDPMSLTMARWFAGNPATRQCANIPDLETFANVDPFGPARRAYDAYLTGAPQIISRWGTGGCFSIYQISMEVTFGSPYVYANGCAEVSVLPTGAATPVNVELPCCDETPIFVPPCYAQPFDPTDLSRDNCWEQPIQVRRSFFEIEPIGSRRFAPVVTLGDNRADAASSADSLNARVAFYKRYPTDRPFTITADVEWFECNRKLGVVEIPFMPGNSELVMDGRTQEVYLDYVGERFDRQVAQGENGAPLSIPSSDGTFSIIVVVEVDLQDNGAESTATIERCDQFVTAGGA